VRALIMNSIVRIALITAALIAASPLLLVARPAHAQAANGNGNGNVNNCDGPCNCDGEFCDPPPRDPPPQQQAPPPVTGAESSGASINGLADQRFNQMITNRVLGSVLLGVNEQINCHDCVSAFGSAGSFSAGIGGRLGFRITQGWVADLFVNGTLGPQPVGNTIHGGVGLRVNYWRLLIARLTAIADDTTLPLISQGKEKGAEGGVRWQSRGSESTPTTRAPTPSSPTRRCSRWRRRRASSSNGCPIR
jgi:hypothetical protein